MVDHRECKEGLLGAASGEGLPVEGPKAAPTLSVTGDRGVRAYPAGSGEEERALRVGAARPGALREADVPTLLS